MKLFQKGVGDTWKIFAEKIGAEYYKGGLIKNRRITVPVKKWQIVIDLNTVNNIPFTRVRCPFLSNSDFKLKIHRKSIFSFIAKLFGVRGIEIGFPEFDSKFLVKSNEVSMAMNLLSNSKIRELFLHISSLTLTFDLKKLRAGLGKKVPKNAKMLYFQEPSQIKDVDMLQNIVNLFREILMELHRLSVVSDIAPDIKL